VEIHAILRGSHWEKRNAVIVFKGLDGPVGVEIQVVVILVALLGHVSLFQGGCVYTERTVQRAGGRISTPSVTMLMEQHHLSDARFSFIHRLVRSLVYLFLMIWWQRRGFFLSLPPYLNLHAFWHSAL
jgi:hypothetical protein